MNYSKEIFKILDIEINEEFKLVGNKFFEPFDYRINEELTLEQKSIVFPHSNWEKSVIEIKDVILEKLPSGIPCKLVKIKKPKTTKEKLAIDYAYACGYKWLVKEKDGTILMFDKKPIRGERHWFKNNYKDKANIVELPISFIKWEDEPYYIGD